MHSECVLENVKPAFAKADNDLARRIIQNGLAYQHAIKKNDHSLMEKAYTNIVTMAQTLEKATGLAILRSPDGSCYHAVLQFSAMLQSIAEKQTAKQLPERGSQSFGTIQDAHEWLLRQNTILVDQFQVDVDSTILGLVAGHSYASHIRIDYTDYKKPVGYRYGVLSEEHTKLFGYDTEEYMKIWSERNPDAEWIKCQTASNSRFGNGMATHQRFFILYRMKTVTPKQTGSMSFDDLTNAVQAALCETAWSQAAGDCPGCGTPTRRDYRFCKHCGLPLQDYA